MTSRPSLLLSFAVGLMTSMAMPGQLQASPDTRHFEFTYLVRVANLPADAKTLRLWVPLPQSDPYQTITELKIDSPVTYSRHRELAFGNENIYLEVPVEKLPQPFELRLHFLVDRREHRVSLDARNVLTPGNADPANLDSFLHSERLVPIDGVIAQLAEQQTRGVKTPLEKARAIYNYVVSTMRYDKSGEGWGRGDALWACTSKRGNCTDFHSVFIGMMRAVGIPARFEIGFPLPADKPQADIPGYHCWAEFYIEPYGWIPVDASEAWKNPAKRDYFFGAHDVNRVQFTTGRDLRLLPAQQDAPLNYFIYPYAEVDGKALSSLEYKFSFRDLPPTSD